MCWLRLFHEKSTKQPYQNQGNTNLQSPNKVFRAGQLDFILLDTGAYASYGLNPTPQSPIGSECVDVKGEISHPTLNMLLKLGDCYSLI